jgi:carboxypeptidase Taq
MTVSQALERLAAYEKQAFAYNHASGVLYYDGATVAPKGSADVRADTLGELSRMSYILTTAPETVEMLQTLVQARDRLDPVTARKVSELWRDYEQTHRIPQEEFVAYQQLVSKADAVWHEAKERSDYALFEPYLQRIFDSCRRLAEYMQPDKDPYDAQLDRFERGLTRDTCDRFFAALRRDLVPLIEQVQAHADRVNDAPLHRDFPVAIQREFTDFVMGVMDIDRDHCIVGETEHPFTINFSRDDVRITTNYHADLVASSLYSVVHEGGHALYELGADDCYNYTALAGGVSMGIHESQSRFYENIIGRSPAYVHAVFPKLKELFPEQLADVDENMFYRAINKAEPSLIRTEADELTYCLHIMVRYEIEKQLIGGTLAVKDVPAEWKRLYKKYLGVDVPSDREGCLQDSHWSGGSIGYFPSYALGSAYGAQMLHKMQEEIGDIWPDVAKGDLSKVTDWLRSHIHRYASFKKPGELFESVCGKFDAKYYTDYLTEKYTKLYGL